MYREIGALIFNNGCEYTHTCMRHNMHACFIVHCLCLMMCVVVQACVHVYVVVYTAVACACEDVCK